jgi:transposase
MEHRITIISLFRNGKKIREISRELGLSRNSVRKIIREESGKKIEEISIPAIKRFVKVSDYNGVIIKWLEQEPTLSSVRIWEKLRAECGYGLGYDTVRRYMARVKHSQYVYPFLEHIAPGEEAQIDFGYIGYLIDPVRGKRRKAYVFCMRLIYSRYDYYELVFDQSVKSFLECHIRAFKYFGGVPSRIRMDNLGSGILNKEFYDPTYQKDYAGLSVHYGFAIEACRCYRPKDKAFVENGIRYVKHNFVAGRTFSDIEDARAQLKSWMAEKALRQHGTTRRKPYEVFINEEQPVLKKLASTDYELSMWAKRKLHPDCYIEVEKSYYSVPYAYAGKELNVRVTQSLVEIHDDELTIICVHYKALKERSRITQQSHFPEWFSNITSRHYKDYYLKSVMKLGETVYQYCEKITEVYQNSSYRMVQGIIALGKKHGQLRLEQACQRASFYNNYSYICIKNILTKNLVADIKDFEQPEDIETSDTFKADLKQYDLFLSIH